MGGRWGGGYVIQCHEHLKERDGFGGDGPGESVEDRVVVWVVDNGTSLVVTNLFLLYLRQTPQQRSTCPQIGHTMNPPLVALSPI